MADQLPAIDQRPTHVTPDGPREELAALIAGWLHHAREDPDIRTEHDLAAALAARFTTVLDDWQVTESNPFGRPPGRHQLHQRDLVARLRRQDIVLTRVTDRSVG